MGGGISQTLMTSGCAFTDPRSANTSAVYAQHVCKESLLELDCYIMHTVDHASIVADSPFSLSCSNRLRSICCLLL